MYGGMDFPLMYYNDAMALRNMADYMGVSKSALRFRLNELGMIEERSINEYDFAMEDLFRVRRCI